MTSLFPVSRFGNYMFADKSFDDLFNVFFNSPTRSYSSRTSAMMTPLANVHKDDEGYQIALAAPGMSRDMFNITVEDGYLVVTAENDQQSDLYASAMRQEFNYTSFERSWQLPEQANVENISARYDAGILYLTIPYTNEMQGKLTINVE